MQFIEQANSHHPTIKFTAEVSDTDTTFLDTSICRVKHFSTHISQVASHQGSKRASLKAKHLGFSGQTPQKLRSNCSFKLKKHISRKEDTPKL